MFSLAVVAVDAVSWYRTDATVFDALPDHPERALMLARAGLFRLVTSDRAATMKPASVKAAYLTDSTASLERLLTHLDVWCSGIEARG